MPSCKDVYPELMGMVSVGLDNQRVSSSRAGSLRANKPSPEFVRCRVTPPEIFNFPKGKGSERRIQVDDDRCDWFPGLSATIRGGGLRSSSTMIQVPCLWP